MPFRTSSLSVFTNDSGRSPADRARQFISRRLQGGHVSELKEEGRANVTGRESVVVVVHADAEEVVLSWVNLGHSEPRHSRLAGTWSLALDDRDTIEKLTFARIGLCTSAGAKAMAEVGVAFSAFLDLSRTIELIRAEVERLRQVWLETNLEREAKNAERAALTPAEKKLVPRLGMLEEPHLCPCETRSQRKSL